MKENIADLEGCPFLAPIVPPSLHLAQPYTTFRNPNLPSNMWSMYRDKKIVLTRTISTSNKLTGETMGYTMPYIRRRRRLHNLWRSEPRKYFLQIGARQLGCRKTFNSTQTRSTLVARARRSYSPRNHQVGTIILGLVRWHQRTSWMQSMTCPYKSDILNNGALSTRYRHLFLRDEALTREAIRKATFS
jgi:hypothetical protein